MQISDCFKYLSPQGIKPNRLIYKEECRLYVRQKCTFLTPNNTTMPGSTSTTSTKSKNEIQYDQLIEGDVQGYTYNLVKPFLQEGGRKVPLPFDNILAKLLVHIKSISTEIEREQRCNIEHFTIGKTFVNSRKRKQPSGTRKAVKFDVMDPNTWLKKDGISNRWQFYKKEGYDGLITIVCVDKEVLTDEVTIAHPEMMNQDLFALGLEQQLMHHFTIKQPDKRCANKSYDTGGKSKSLHKGGIVYFAYKMAKDDSGNFPKETGATQEEEPIEKKRKIHQNKPLINFDANAKVKEKWEDLMLLSEPSYSYENAVKGTVYQNRDSAFDTRNKSTCVALASLLTAQEYDPSCWTPSMIDQIVLLGKEMHDHIMPNLNTSLTVDGLPREGLLGGYNMVVITPLYVPFMNIEKELPDKMENEGGDSNAFFIRISDFVFGLIPKDGKIFFFDSHSGSQLGDPYAVCKKYGNVRAFARVLKPIGRRCGCKLDDQIPITPVRLFKRSADVLKDVLQAPSMKGILKKNVTWGPTESEEGSAKLDSFTDKLAAQSSSFEEDMKGKDKGKKVRNTKEKTFTKKKKELRIHVLDKTRSKTGPIFRNTHNDPCPYITLWVLPESTVWQWAYQLEKEFKGISILASSMSLKQDGTEKLASSDGFEKLDQARQRLQQLDKPGKELKKPSNIWKLFVSMDKTKQEIQAAYLKQKELHFQILDNNATLLGNRAFRNPAGGTCGYIALWVSPGSTVLQWAGQIEKAFKGIGGLERSISTGLGTAEKLDPSYSFEDLQRFYQESKRPSKNWKLYVWINKNKKEIEHAYRSKTEVGQGKTNKVKLPFPVTKPKQTLDKDDSKEMKGKPQKTEPIAICSVPSTLAIPIKTEPVDVGASGVKKEPLWKTTAQIMKEDHQEKMKMEFKAKPVTNEERQKVLAAYDKFGTNYKGLVADVYISNPSLLMDILGSSIVPSSEGEAKLKSRAQRIVARRKKQTNAEKATEDNAGLQSQEEFKLIIVNLHNDVKQDKIHELFGVIGATKRVTLLTPGTAEVVYVKKEDALSAQKKYNNWEYYGRPMNVHMVTSG